MYFARSRAQLSSFPVSPFGRSRSEQTDLKLVDTAVSRKHAELNWQDGAWVLTNHAQANPVRVNGNIVTAPCALKGGEILAFHGNKTVFEFAFNIQDDDATVVVSTSGA